MLIVGAGTSFDECHGLMPTATALAATGLTVLVLSPSGGTVPLPGSVESGLPAPAAIELRRADVLRELDKRLDAVAWPPELWVNAVRAQAPAAAAAPAVYPAAILPFEK